jgi:hypothetical protein
MFLGVVRSMKLLSLNVGIMTFGILCGITADAREFGGYKCTKDCSGHKAGYEWAEAQGLTNQSQCWIILRRNPRRTSFYEGCLVYIDDPDRGADEDDDGEEID